MNRPATVTQATIARAIRGAEKNGLAVFAVEIDPRGVVRLLTRPPVIEPLTELERWRAQHGGGQA